MLMFGALAALTGRASTGATTTLCRKTAVGPHWTCRDEVPPVTVGNVTSAGTASPPSAWKPLDPETANPCDCRKTLFTPAAYGGELHPFPFRSAVEAARFAPEPVPRRQSNPFRSGGACHNSTRHTRPGEVAAFAPCGPVPGEAASAAGRRRDGGTTSAVVRYGSCTRALSASLFFIPEFKLILCGIPKNGVTGYLQLVRRAMVRAGARRDEGGGHFHHPHAVHLLTLDP